MGEDFKTFADILEKWLPGPVGPGSTPGPSYRHMRPFPKPPRAPFDTHEKRANLEAWKAESERRGLVKYRWDMRRAWRKKRRPKGHDHPEWV